MFPSLGLGTGVRVVPTCPPRLYSVCEATGLNGGSQSRGTIPGRDRAAMTASPTQGPRRAEEGAWQEAWQPQWALRSRARVEDGDFGETGTFVSPG